MKDFFNDLNYKILATSLFAFFFACSLLYLGYKIGPGEQIYPVTFILCIFGFVLGWVIGILVSPYDEDDKKKLGNFSKLIGTFLSGYILSKFDRVVETFITGELVSNQLIGIRLILFVCAFCLSFIVVYVFRQYTSAEEIEEIIEE